MINNRRVVISFVDFDEGGAPLIFEDLKIVVKGNRTGSFVTNSATISITNIRKDVRDQLTTKYRPVENLMRGINDRRGWIYVDIGRVGTDDGSGGAELFRLIEGGVISITQSAPPDITLTFNIVANFRQKSQIDSYQFGNNIKLSRLTQEVAKILNLSANYIGDNDPLLPTMNYSGTSWGLIEMIDNIVGYNATEDNGQLTVYPINGVGDVKIAPVKINKDTGMVGSPTATDSGISFVMLASGSVSVGTRVETSSQISPATNGIWRVVAINFEITNRDNPFYYTCRCVAEIRS